MWWMRWGDTAVLCCAGRTRRWIGREYWLVKEKVRDGGLMARRTASGIKARHAQQDGLDDTIDKILQSLHLQNWCVACNCHQNSCSIGDEEPQHSEFSSKDKAIDFRRTTTHQTLDAIICALKHRSEHSPPPSNTNTGIEACASGQS